MITLNCKIYFKRIFLRQRYFLLLHFAAIFVLVALFNYASGLDPDTTCAVCRAVVDEVNYSISLVDPKKTIQVGSFRVDARGNQDTYKKPYARSEVHLIEVFESLCEKFRDYAQSTDEAGKKSVARTKSRNNEPLSLRGISVSADIQKQLKFTCENLVEEYEDEMIKVFGNEKGPDAEKQICVDMTDLCSNEDLEVPMPSTKYEPEATDDLKEPEEEEEEGEEAEESTDALPEAEEVITESPPEKEEL